MDIHYFKRYKEELFTYLKNMIRVLYKKIKITSYFNVRGKNFI